MSAALSCANRCAGSLLTVAGRQSPVEGLPRVLGGCVTLCVATLKATYGEKYPYAEPFPYWKKPYKFPWSWIDKTIPRINENSKVIVVEGNVAVGKKDFARRLAKLFDLKYIGPTTEAAAFIDKNYGFDCRALNPLIPEGTRYYDLQKFYADKHPEKGTIGRLQLRWYEEKFYDYAAALKHVLSTGQGVVLVRSPYSDSVFADAMRRCGYVTPQFTEYYNLWRASSLCELWKPHMTIYLDAPLKVIRQRINERKDDKEVNSKVLSDSYLQTIADVYRDKFLPTMKQSGEVVEIDWAEKASDVDMEVIAEELELYQLVAEDNEDKKFEDWERLNKHDYQQFRLFLDNYSEQRSLFIRPLPWDCPELIFTSEDDLEYQRVLRDHPIYKHAPGWSPELGHNALFKF